MFDIAISLIEDDHLIGNNDSPIYLTSVELSEKMHILHPSVLFIIRKYMVAMNEYGDVLYESIKNKHGRPTIIYHLNKSQFLVYIAHVRITEYTIILKKAFIRERVRVRKEVEEIRKFKENENQINKAKYYLTLLEEDPDIKLLNAA